MSSIDVSIFQEVARLERENEPGALCTIISSKGSTPRHTGSKMLVYVDGHFTGTVGGGEVESRVMQEAMDALKDGKTRLLNYNMVNPNEGDPGVCGGQLEVYVEPILPRPTLLIIGSGHVGKAVAHLARWLDFHVVVSDDREEFVSRETNPDANKLLSGKMIEIPERIHITPQTYIVLTTRGMNVDVEGLPGLLESQAAYIGVIGSKRRWAVTRKVLADGGVAKEILDRVHSPIGLELNAETPEEIAVSIMAEIIMLRNGGSGKQMKAD